MTMSAIRNRRAVLIAVLNVLILFSAGYSVGEDQTSQPDECPVPTFSFRWVSADVVRMKVSAERRGTIRVKVEAPRPVQPEPPLYRPWSRKASWENPPVIWDNDVKLDPSAGTSVTMVPSEADLISLDGRVRITWSVDDPDRCEGRTERDVVIIKKDRLSVDLGASWELNADGTFTSKPEVALSTVSRWYDKWSTALDLRITQLGAVSENDNTSSSPQAPNPFTSGGSTIEGSVRVLFHPFGKVWNNPRLSGVLGTGFRTVPKGSIDFVDARGKVFGGLRFNVFSFNPGLSEQQLGGVGGFLELGLAYDRFWKDVPEDNSAETTNRSERIYAVGQLEVPGLTGQVFHILLRGRADMSFEFRGPTEIQISALASLTPSGLSTLFGGIGSK